MPSNVLWGGFEITCLIEWDGCEITFNGVEGCKITCCIGVEGCEISCCGVKVMKSHVL